MQCDISGVKGHTAERVGIFHLEGLPRVPPWCRQQCLCSCSQLSEAEHCQRPAMRRIVDMYIRQGI